MVLYLRDKKKNIKSHAAENSVSSKAFHLGINKHNN